MAKLVSKVYGDALFEAAMEKDDIPAWYDEVQALRSIFMQETELVRLLNHPQVMKEEKTRMIRDIFSGRLSEELVGFLVLAVEKGRQNEILPICDYFIGRVKEYRKIGGVTVTSAVELTREQKKEIEEKLLDITGYVSLETEYGVDAKLIGGLVIRIGDRVVDSSIRTKLEELKRELLRLQLA